MMQVVAVRGRIDCLVNCAVSFLNKGLDVTTADWERSLGVNVRGGANMVQACFEPMRKQGGAIVNIASISAHIAQPNRWTYNATKGAIVALTKCQALDLAPHNIRVNSVSPGWIWTPIGRCHGTAVSIFSSVNSSTSTAVLIRSARARF